MKFSSRRLVLLIVLLTAAARLTAADNAVGALAFLTGQWRGTATSGRTAEESFSSGEGGVMLSAGREFSGGKCVFYDLVVFTEKGGVLTLIPHPNGKISPHVFPVTKIDAAARRAIFENPEHNFPRKFVYELVGSDHLRITLTGVIQGKPAEEVYDLKRVP